jgi:hypothetical protein
VRHRQWLRRRFLVLSAFSLVAALAAWLLSGVVELCLYKCYDESSTHLDEDAQPNSRYVGHDLVTIRCGQVLIEGPPPGLTEEPDDGITIQLKATTPSWRCDFHYGLAPAIPLWILPAAATLLMGAAGAPMITTALRRRRGLCPSCAYDRRGLAPGAPCPECGKTPA